MLPKLFSPTSIAVLGVSKDTTKVGHICLRNIKNSNYSGEVYPVNPAGGEILGYPVFTNSDQVKKIPDLCVISLPIDIALAEIEKTAKRGWKNFVVYTAGFKESGTVGAKKEEQLKELIIKYELNLLGPNCFGFVNNRIHLNLTFGQTVNTYADLNFISQSGAIAASIFDWASYHGIGFSDFVTLGNKTSLDECDVLEHWISEYEKTGVKKPIGMYLESINDGRRFLSLVSKVTPFVPVFIIKPGKSDLAKKSMKSHTGSLAGSDVVLDGAFKQYGVIRCSNLGELFDMIMAISWGKIPHGNSGAIISNAGGPAVISSDLISENNLSLVEFDEATKKKLYEHLPPSASVIDPIDVLGDALADSYAQSLATVLTQPSVKFVLAILTPQIMTQIEQTALALSLATNTSEVPVYATFIGGKEVLKGTKILSEKKIPHFSFPEDAIKVISKLYWWSEVRGRIEPVILSKNFASTGNRKVLSYKELEALIKKYSLQSPKYLEITAEKVLLDVQETLGYPVVLKISDENVLHKTEQKGVYVNISDKTDLHARFRDLRNAFPNSTIIAQEQISDGVEIILGVKRDPNFGHVLMFGGGGVFTELVADINLRILPLGNDDYFEFISSSKVFKLLSGYRNMEKVNLNALERLIKNVSKMVLEIPEIVEFEINPVISTSKKSYSVDIKCILEV